MIKGYMLVGCWEECEGGIEKVYSGKLYKTREEVMKEFDQARKEGHFFDSFRIIEEKREDVDRDEFLNILSGLEVSSLKDGYVSYLNALSLIYSEAAERDEMIYEKTCEECYKGVAETYRRNQIYIHDRLMEWGFYDDVRKMREV